MMQFFIQVCQFPVRETMRIFQDLPHFFGFRKGTVNLGKRIREPDFFNMPEGYGIFNMLPQEF